MNPYQLEALNVSIIAAIVGVEFSNSGAQDLHVDKVVSTGKKKD